VSDVLILGGSRFIGRRLARELSERGDAVTLFTRGRTPDGLGTAVRRLTGDRRSAADLERAAASRAFDVVYDFLSYDARDARLAVDAFAGRIGRFVHISTCSVYWCAGEFPCPVEEDDFDRLDVSRERSSSIEYAYGMGKRGAEDALSAAHRDRGFPVTAVRLPIVGGEEDASLRCAGYVQRILDGGPLVLPDGGHAPFRHVYVGDVTRALASIPDRPAAAGRAYNLACSEILTLRRVVAALASALGRRVRVIDVPSSLARGVLGEGYAAWSPFSQRAAQVPCIARARRELAWETTPFAEWIDRAARWCVDRLAAGGEPPPAAAHRGAEADLLRRWSEALVSFGAEASTSAELPG
jgi:nucleoside-diphosphate-sugar epimerase